ncbi:MAG: glycoside hydrolase family 97 protein [Bacteroidaceae bacterium]|nr:glycoside hydrolase family 97 protein [Bacteroidaceae bacterium]
MKRLSFLLLLLLPLVSEAKEAVVASPDGKLIVTINDNDGHITYAASLNGKKMLLPSALGFVANFGDFTQGLSIVGTSASRVDKSYEMRQVKQSKMHYVASKLAVEVENARQQKMTIEFSVSDHDLAFRYLIPRQKNDNPKCAVIEREATAFNLPQGTTTFLTPQCNPMIGWERTKPSYEEGYRTDAAMTDRSFYGQGYTFPCLFRLPSPASGTSRTKPNRTSQKASAKSPQSETDGWILISETGVSSQYCGSHLSDYDPRRGYVIAYPMPGENNGFGSASPAISLPGSTPWRTVTVGESLKPIVETTIAYDLVEPLYEPSQQYACGRYTWSWLIWQDNSVNWDDQVSFIDLASAMGYEFCLVDGWWDKNIGRERMGKLSEYAREKGVALMLWYNSNGAENDAPQTPRDCMNTSIARDREMAWLKSIGVKGIKVDFFGGDKQETMKLYEDILCDANRYGIQCIFHGCTLPRGWERMYPNYVSSEAVLASENVYFNEDAARREPFDLTMHPFCRNAVGTMDWGGVIMNRFMSRDNKSRHTRKTTNVFEMASGITNQAAIQCVAMQPNNLGELTQAELDFLRRMPSTWDETRFIDGYPGRYVVLARRHGADWYVAGLNGTAEPLTISVSMPMFKAGEAVTLLSDVADRKDKATMSTVKSAPKLDKLGRLKVTLQPGGGMIVHK